MAATPAAGHRPSSHHHPSTHHPQRFSTSFLITFPVPRNPTTTACPSLCTIPTRSYGMPLPCCRISPDPHISLTFFTPSSAKNPIAPAFILICNTVAPFRSPALSPCAVCLHLSHLTDPSFPNLTLNLQQPHHPSPDAEPPSTFTLLPLSAAPLPAISPCRILAVANTHTSHGLPLSRTRASLPAPFLISHLQPGICCTHAAAAAHNPSSALNHRHHPSHGRAPQAISHGRCPHTRPQVPPPYRDPGSGTSTRPPSSSMALPPTHKPGTPFPLLCAFDPLSSINLKPSLLPPRCAQTHARSSTAMPRAQICRKS